MMNVGSGMLHGSGKVVVSDGVLIASERVLVGSEGLLLALCLWRRILENIIR